MNENEPKNQREPGQTKPRASKVKHSAQPATPQQVAPKQPGTEPAQAEEKEFTPSRRSNLFKRKNGSYYGRAMVFGERKKKSFGKVPLDVATRELANWLAGLRGEVALTPENSISRVGELIGQYRESIKTAQHAASHRLFIANRFKFLEATWPELAGLQVAEVTETDVRAWVSKCREDGYSDSTIKNTLLYLKKSFDQIKGAMENPCAGIKIAATPFDHDSERRKLSPQEFDLILAEMRRIGGKSRPAADLVELLAATGARIGEVVGTDDVPPLRWRDVDWQRRQLTLSTEKGRRAKAQHNRRRIIPFHPRLESILERLRAKRKEPNPNAKVVSVKVAKGSLKGAPKRLFKKGVIRAERLNHHDLRHLFCTWAIEAGIDIPTVADLLGHRDGGALLLRNYRHLRTEHLHAQAKKLAALAPGAPAAPVATAAVPMA